MIEATPLKCDASGRLKCHIIPVDIGLKLNPACLWDFLSIDWSVTSKLTVRTLMQVMKNFLFGFRFFYFEFERSGIVDANMFERIHSTVDSSFWQWSHLLFHRGRSQLFALRTRRFDLGAKYAQSEDHIMFSYRCFHCGETDRMLKLKVQTDDQKFREVWSSM